MLKRFLNRLLFFFTLCTTATVVAILLNKDDFRETYSQLGITYIPDKYWLINFIFGWPVIVTLLALAAWLTVQQFRIDSVIRKVKLNSIFLMSTLLIIIMWFSIVYIPMSHLSN